MESKNPEECFLLVEKQSEKSEKFMVAIKLQIAFEEKQAIFKEK